MTFLKEEQIGNPIIVDGMVGLDEHAVSLLIIPALGDFVQDYPEVKTTMKKIIPLVDKIMTESDPEGRTKMEHAFMAQNKALLEDILEKVSRIEPFNLSPADMKNKKPEVVFKLLRYVIYFGTTLRLF